jgi:hypothetical protein
MRYTHDAAEQRPQRARVVGLAVGVGYMDRVLLLDQSDELPPAA